MFKFKVGQHVWFLVGPISDYGDPEYLEGDITKQYVDDDHHGSPDAWYKIQAADGMYDGEESALYASFDELYCATTKELKYGVLHAEFRVIRAKRDLADARDYLRASEKRLARWEKKHDKPRS